MKTAFLFFLLSGVIIANAQPGTTFKLELNQYGEAKTSLEHGSLMQPWPQKMLEANKDSIIRKVGEGMYYDISNHSAANVIPSKITSELNDDEMRKYVVWFVMPLPNDHYIVRVRDGDNQHVSAGYRMADKSDFYLVLFGSAMKNYMECKQGSANKPSSYPEGSYARNYKNTETNSPGDDELDKGLEAANKYDYEAAMEFYKKSAEKGNRVAMYNIGVMYYNNKVQTGYDSKSVLEQTLNRNNSNSQRMSDAFKWFQKSADKEYPAAMYMLGRMYKDGEGVAANISEARKWLQKAADKGHVKAQELLKAL